MASIHVGGRYEVSDIHNYVIGGNVCNAFAVGTIGSEDDFFLVGAALKEESPYPLLTGNILDSEGNSLFRIVRNIITFNPGNCSRIWGDLTGYEIHDGAGHLIFAVRTMFEPLPSENDPMFVTTLQGTFYDKQRRAVMTTNFGDAGESLMANGKIAMGLGEKARYFTTISNMSEAETQLAALAVQSGGAIHQLLTGEHSGETILLDGKLLYNVQFTNCEVIVEHGDFKIEGPVGFDRCNFTFRGPAGNVQSLYDGLIELGGTPPVS